MTPRRAHHRRGSTLPLVGVLLISLFGFVALAVDVGMLAVARTNCQNAADVAALAGCRTLNNKPGVSDNNRANALTAASSAATSNALLSANVTSAQVQSVTAGVYAYDTSNASSPTFTVSYPTSLSTGESWTAMRVVVSVDQPTYFARVLGFSSMPIGATATAVYRPRDVAFVLDMTGSMAYASTFNSSSANGTDASLDPNNLVPSFGHYGSVTGSIKATATAYNSDNEAFSRNNFTIETPAGPPIIRNFYFDPTNIGTPTTVASPVTIITDNTDPSNPQKRPQSNAFHRSNVTETAGNPTNYTPPTYDFSNYDPLANTATEGATPAPDWYGDQIDSGSQIYAGDRWRRKDGRIYKTSTSWTAASTRMAGNAAELLGYTVTTNSGNKYIQYDGAASYTSSTAVAIDRFQDPVWEANGYDLDIAGYRSWRSASNSNKPGKASQYSTLLASADQFKGYTMGPGYWGKTFFIWPPDPRPAKDWRKKFFTNWSGSPSSTNIDNSLVESTANNHVLNSGSYTPNYSAILAWIKSGPQVLPPNLRAGRVVYYTSIPDDTNTGTGSTAQKLDKVFWKNYIDYVLANGATYSTYNSDSSLLYGYADSWSTVPLSLYTGSMSNAWTGPSGVSGWTTAYPYLAYSDSPNRPRLHLWFGPLSMVDFIGRAGGHGNNPALVNWRPGTCYEGQSWILKAAMNSVLTDVRNNHPNDNVGMTMFSQPSFYDARVPMGQDYTALKNALFYPKSLLTAINGGDTTSEFRPYDQNWNDLNTAGEIPNSLNYTDPNTGLAAAFNLLSPSATLDTSVYGTVKGRRGASKIVIFETDGVPNAYRTLTLTKKGYDTYYSIGSGSGYRSNNDSTSKTQATTVVTQMVKTMASNNTTNVDSGLSLPNAPCRVYSIAFGDLFDTSVAPSATSQRNAALQFLADVQVAGGTSASGASTIPTTQIITGSSTTRISTMRTCLQNIFGSGVTVSLIE